MNHTYNPALEIVTSHVSQLYPTLAPPPPAKYLSLIHIKPRLSNIKQSCSPTQLFSVLSPSRQPMVFLFTLMAAAISPTATPSPLPPENILSRPLPHLLQPLCFLENSLVSRASPVLPPDYPVIRLPMDLLMTVVTS